MRRDKLLQFSEKLINYDKSTCTFIAKYDISNDLYEIDLEDDNDTSVMKTRDNKPWIIIRHTTFNNRTGYRLKVGNIIKFGKTLFKVTEMKTDYKRYNKDIRTFAEVVRDDPINDNTDNYVGNNFINNIEFIQICKYDKKNSDKIFVEMK
jgi:hypothetical protein